MAIAFPFVEVGIDSSALQPIAQRAPGVLAIVGASNAGSVGANVPTVVTDATDAGAKFGASTALGKALTIALLQDPGPSTIYGVKLNAGDWDTALASLEAAADVTFVALADAPLKSDATLNAPVIALKNHCENQSAAGHKRIGVAVVDPAWGRAATYAADVIARATAVKSTTSRMVMVAARGATVGSSSAEVAAAAAAAMAGFAPATSVVLKKVVGFSMPLASQFAPAEIKALAADGIIPVLVPALASGQALVFGEGTTYTTDAALGFIDIVRLLDDVEFKLKAALLGMIGDARISRTGLAAIIRRADGVLDQIVSSGAITDYSVTIPVYEALLKPEAARSAGEQMLITNTRAQRLVDMTVVITIGPAVHRLKVALQPRF